MREGRQQLHCEMQVMRLERQNQSVQNDTHALPPLIYAARQEVHPDFRGGRERPRFRQRNVGGVELKEESSESHCNSKA